VRPNAAIAGALMFAAASGAMACDCATLSLSRRVAESDLVLVARVSAYKQLDYVKLSPTEIFKGSAPKELTIQTGVSDCDFFLPPLNPRVGDKYLLYLRQSEGKLSASRCLASGRTKERETDLRALRKKGR
jgi:hypothetical protein